MGAIPPQDHSLLCALLVRRPPAFRMDILNRTKDGGQTMSSRKHSTEQIIRKRREAEVELAKGRSVREVCKHLGVTDQTYYRWRKEYGGIRTDQARRLKELERENSRLKKVVADLTLDNVILKEAASGNF